MLMWPADTKDQNQCLLLLSELMLMTLVRLCLALGFYCDVVILLLILLSLSLTESIGPSHVILSCQPSCTQT